MLISLLFIRTSQAGCSRCLWRHLFSREYGKTLALDILIYLWKVFRGQAAKKDVDEIIGNVSQVKSVPYSFFQKPVLEVIR